MRTRHLIRVVALALLAATLALGLEAGSYLFLTTARARNPLLFRVTARELAERLLPTLPGFLRCEAWICPHATLGWWHHPGKRGDVGYGPITADEVGSRVVPGASGPVLVSSYGDSFTEGIEVDDASTWQAHLSRLSGSLVQNFGVMGYGPDQALLYLQHNLGRGGRVPVVVLGVITENLNRLMIAFRPFYTYPAFDIPLGFKPILVRSDGRYAFRAAFAPERPLDRAELEAAIQRAGDFDAFQRLRTEDVTFPFSVRAAHYLLRYGLKPRFRWPSEESEAHQRMAFVLEEFWRASRVHRFIPVLLLMPVDEKELRQPVVAGLQPVLARLGAEAARDIVLVDIATERRRALASKEAIEEGQPYLVRTHPSRYGNRVIATLLRRRLCGHPRIKADPELADGLCRDHLARAPLHAWELAQSND